MRSIIQDLIGMVVLIGVLFSASKSTVKKGAEAYKYAVKIFKPIKTAPKRQQNVSAEPKKRTIFGRILRSGWLWFGMAIAFQMWALAHDLSRTGPLTRWVVVQIAMDCALLVAIILMAVFMYFFERLATWITKTMEMVAVLSDNVIAHVEVTREVSRMTSDISCALIKQGLLSEADLPALKTSKES